MSDFRMPSLGADMDKGKVVEWLKKPGDRIARGDVVAVVETQKGAFEIEVFEEGVLSEILVAVGSEAPVGAVLARIDGVGAAPLAAAPPLVPPLGPPVRPAPPLTPTRAPPTVPAPPPGERLRISPAAARRALELGVDVRGLRGSGPQGAIAVADVEAAVKNAGGSRAAPRLRSGGHAPGDRARHGALQARDPALLPIAADRHGPRARMAG